MIGARTDRRLHRVFEPGVSSDDGVTILKATCDLDLATKVRSRTELLRFSELPHVTWAVVLLGPRRFVDHRGLQVLIEASARLRDRSADLVVVSPPHCLERMLGIFNLDDALWTADDVWSAASIMLSAHRPPA